LGRQAQVSSALDLTGSAPKGKAIVHVYGWPPPRERSDLLGRDRVVDRYVEGLEADAILNDNQAGDCARVARVRTVRSVTVP
jgi:hypothetical protein